MCYNQGMEPANTNPTPVQEPLADDQLPLEELLAKRRAEGDPWAKMAGIFKDDPTFDEWVEIMRENRRRDDEETPDGFGSTFLTPLGRTQMQIPILIEPLSDHCYRATSSAPLALTAEAATPDDALTQLRQLVLDRLVEGAKYVALDVPVEDPWRRFAGSLRDNPLFDDWVEAMREYREKVDSETYPWEQG